MKSKPSLKVSCLTSDTTSIKSTHLAKPRSKPRSAHLATDTVSVSTGKVGRKRTSKSESSETKGKEFDIQSVLCQQYLYYPNSKVGSSLGNLFCS